MSDLDQRGKLYLGKTFDLTTQQPGDVLRLTIYRGWEKQSVDVILGRQPS